MLNGRGLFQELLPAYQNNPISTAYAKAPPVEGLPTANWRLATKSCLLTTTISSPGPDVLD